ELGARLHRSTTDVDGAGAARRRVAPHLRAGETDVVPEEVDEQGSGFDVCRHRPAVHGHVDPHGSPPSLLCGEGHSVALLSSPCSGDDRSRVRAVGSGAGAEPAGGDQARGTQLPWNPKGTRVGRWIVATGGAPKSRASTTMTSLRSVAAS